MPVSDLAHAWPLSESAGTNAPDVIGGLDGTFHATYPPSWIFDATRGNVVRFNGEDQRIDVSSTFNVDQTAFTICLWVKNTDWPTNKDIRFLSKATGSASSNHRVMVGHTSNFGPRARARVDAGGSVVTAYAETADKFINDTWEHYSYSYDGSNVHVHINGVLSRSTSKTGTVANDSTTPVAIGNQPQGGSSSDGINNDVLFMNDLRVYSRALSTAEILLVKDEALPSGGGGSIAAIAHYYNMMRGYN